jgi:hypothetical protein
MMWLGTKLREQKPLPKSTLDGANSVVLLDVYVLSSRQVESVIPVLQRSAAALNILI